MERSGLPWWLSGKSSACNPGDMGSIPGLGGSPWSREWQPTLLFLPGEFHGLRSLAGYTPWGCKELDMTDLLTFFSLFQVCLTLLENIPSLNKKNLL